MGIHRRSAGAVLAALVALVCCSCTSASGSDATRSAPDPSATPSDVPLSLVVIGDSIPNNASYDCPGCDGFVDQYAAALEKATGRSVDVTNLSSHDNMTVPRLLDELPGFRSALTSADAIIVGIAHNTIELNADRPCGTRWLEDRYTFADWSKLTPECARRTTAQARPLYDRLYSTITSWRRGLPTILVTINKYSDWVGWKDAHLDASQEATVVMFHNLWNRMLCASARSHGFACADIYHAFNGPDGTRASGNLLGSDYTHPSQQGNDLIAKTLIAQGFAPLA